MYMGDIKLFANNEKEMDTDTNDRNIQLEYRNGFW